MIRKDKIKAGETILVRSLICKRPVPMVVAKVANCGVYVEETIGTLLVPFNECWYDTESNRDMIVNKNPY